MIKENDTQNSRSHDPGEGPALLAAHTHRVLATVAAPEAVLVRFGQRDLDLRVETEPRVTISHTRLKSAEEERVDHDALGQVVEDGGSEGEHLPTDHRVRQRQADEKRLERRQPHVGRHAEARGGDAERSGGPLGDGVGDGFLQVREAGVTADQFEQVYWREGGGAECGVGPFLPHRNQIPDPRLREKRPDRLLLVILFGPQRRGVEGHGNHGVFYICS